MKKKLATILINKENKKVIGVYYYENEIVITLILDGVDLISL